MDTRELLEHLDRRFEASERAADNRHEDMIRRVEGLDQAVAKAHGRISKHDGILERLERRVQEISDRYHEFVHRVSEIIRAQIQTLLSSKSSIGDNQAVTRTDLRLIYGLIAGSVLATIAALKFLGKLG